MGGANPWLEHFYSAEIARVIAAYREEGSPAGNAAALDAERFSVTARLLAAVQLEHCGGRHQLENIQA